MSAGMPELGSKISLISKADIRYEGRLFTVDPKECTIALASVRSFGTEDRETPYPVPAQNQVYDYILFRGSDIKDIRVVNNVTQPLNDPAIMQLSVPPSLGQQQFQTHPMMGHMGPQLGQFGTAPGYAAAMGTMAGLSGGLMSGGNVGLQRDHPRGNLVPPTGNITVPPTTVPLAGGGGNGSGINNTSGVATNTATPISPHVFNKTHEAILMGSERPTVLSPAVETSRPNDHDIIGGASRSTTPASLASRKSPTNDQGVQAGGSGKQNDYKRTVKPIQPPGQQRYHQPRKSNSQERRNSRGDGQMKDYQRNQNRQSIGRNQNTQSGGSGVNNGNQQRGGWTNRGSMRQRGRPRGSSGYKPNQGQPNQGSKTKNTLKFENDYDFEQANTEFEELRNQLAKVKVEDTPKNEVNGDCDKKDDSGNETGAGENEQEEEHEVFYDKSKSFFDKISCEAVERAKGASQRTDWRTERKLNSETFGVAATRRGNFRGRGGYRGGMGYRGGYHRGNYRPQQRNNRDQQSNNRSQQNDQPQKQNSAPVPAAADSLGK